MFYVVPGGCRSVLNNKISICSVIRDDVNNTFVVIKRTQRRMATGNREVRLGISKLVLKKAEKIDSQYVSNIIQFIFTA